MQSDYELSSRPYAFAIVPFCAFFVIIVRNVFPMMMRIPFGPSFFQMFAKCFLAVWIALALGMPLYAMGLRYKIGWMGIEIETWFGLRKQFHTWSEFCCAYVLNEQGRETVWLAPEKLERREVKKLFRNGRTHYRDCIMIPCRFLPWRESTRGITVGNLQKAAPARLAWIECFRWDIPE